MCPCSDQNTGCTSGVRELTQHSAATKMENDISHCPCQGTPRALGQSELSPLRSTWRVSFISSYYPDGLNVLFWVINVYIELKFLNSKKGHRESLGILITIYSASPSLTGDFPQNYFILSTKQNKATSLIGSLTEPGDFLLNQLRLLQRRNIVFTGNPRVVRVRNSGRRVGTEKQWSSLLRGAVKTLILQPWKAGCQPREKARSWHTRFGVKQ